MTFTPSTFSLLDFDISSFIHDMPGFVIIKDLNSNYLNANLNTVNEFDFKNSDHLYGYSDLTIPHPLSKNGQFYRNLDLEVIQTGESMKGICTFPFQDCIRPYHFKKKILKDTKGNCIATFSHAQECQDTILIQFIQNLIANPLFKSKQMNSLNSFILNREYSGITLSLLESTCLFYLIRQKTKSEIAKLLNLSVNEINASIETIKHQLNAGNLRDILDIAIIKNFMNIIPPGIFNQLYNVKNNSFLPNNLPIPPTEKKLLVSDSNLNKPVKFTNREMDCAKLLMKGFRIKEIAAKINLSPRTVETHINNLKMKLDSRDKIELIIKLRELF